MQAKFLSCRYDHMKITNNNNQTFGVFCGRRRKIVIVTGDFAVLTFHSDSYVQRRGFFIFFHPFVPGNNRRCVHLACLAIYIYIQVL